MTPDEQKTIERLVAAVNLAYNSSWRLFWRGLLWGLGRGLGATLGLAIVLGALFYFLKLTGFDQTLRQLLDSLQNFSESFQNINRP